ncbi:unnamed protein product [Phytomonas sp. EM1]|nr:unnamed protein product [Phytomonas sp. EM1]|eukprot:CCW60564.1 unnamed protein product [Phytomonas sp. isolate EM1]
MPQNHSLQEDINAAWASFSLRWKAQKWRRGCFSLSTVARTEPQDQKNDQPSAPIPQSSGSQNETPTRKNLSSGERGSLRQGSAPEITPRMVDLDLWNRYWKVYSDQYGGLLDGLAMLLDKTATAPISWCAVFLALKQTSPCGMPHSEGNEDEVLEYIQTHLEKWTCDAAHQFGAIESVEYHRRIVKVQFTGPEAAAAFQLWASGLSLETFLRARPSRESLPPKYLTPSSKTLLSELHLQTCLAPRNPVKTNTLLKLGCGMLLPTAHVEALFSGLFDATSIVYRPQDGCFVVSFEDDRSARLALHALQFSLLEVFNMSLEYDEKGVSIS